MQRLRLLGIALMAIFALGAIASATASAENPLILPEPTVGAPLSFTSENVEKTLPLLETTAKRNITCTSLTNKGKFTSGDLGSISVHFEGCKSEKIACNSEGDAKEVILLVEEDVHLVDFKVETTKLVLGMVIRLLPDAKGMNLLLLCGPLNIEVKGEVLGRVDNVKDLVKTKTALVLFHQTKPGEQEFTVCELLKAFCEANKSIKLEANFGKGFELASQVAEDNVTFEKEVEFHF